MFKLIKYDLKNNMKTIVIMLFIFFTLLAITIISKNEGFGVFLILLILVAYVICFLLSLNSLLLYVFPEDEGLFFTIPIEGYKVLLSRIITSLIIFLVPLFIIYFSFSLAFPVFNTPSELDIFYKLNPLGDSNRAMDLTLSIIVNTLIFYIIFFVQLISIFYFSIALSSSSLKNIRLGKILWVIIGLFLEMINVFCMINITKVSQGFRFFHLDKVLIGIIQHSGSGSRYGSYNMVSYNIVDYKLYLPTLVYIIVTTIILFYITSKLIDKKVEIY